MTIFDEKLEAKSNEKRKIDKERIVVLDGPLSSIYTRALIKAYPNENNLVQETQAMDAVTIAAIQQYDDEEKIKQLSRTRDLSYVYATSVSKLNSHDKVSDAIARIERARASNNFKDFGTIIELDKPVDIFSGYLVDYTKESGGDLLFKENRSLALESLRTRTEECGISRAVLRVM